MLYNTIQKLTARLLRFIPVTSEIVGPPKRYTSISNYFCESEPTTNNYTFNYKKFAGSFKEIHVNRTLSKIEPKTLNDNHHWRFCSKYIHELPLAFTTTISQGRAWNHDAVITSNDELLVDVSKCNASVVWEMPKHHSVTVQLRLPQVRCINGTVAMLAVSGGETYAHWLLDLLPRFELLHQSGFSLSDIDYFILNGFKLPFQKEALELFEIPLNKIIVSSPQLHLKADTLVVPSLPRLRFNHSEWTPKWICDFLKKKFLNENDSESSISDRTKRFYISRSNAKFRKVVNETEIEDVLMSFGFQIVSLESMPVDEQAKLFYSATLIIAPHGAGLANLAFCRPNTKVIELFPPSYLNLCYWILSNQIGLDYYYLIGEGKNSEENLYIPHPHEDIFVNPQNLKKILETADVSVIL